LPPQATAAAAAYAGQQPAYGQVQGAAPQTAEEQYAQFMASVTSGQSSGQQAALTYDAYGQLTQR